MDVVQEMRDDLRAEIEGLRAEVARGNEERSTMERRFGDAISNHDTLINTNMTGLMENQAETIASMIARLADHAATTCATHTCGAGDCCLAAVVRKTDCAGTVSSRFPSREAVQQLLHCSVNNKLISW